MSEELTLENILNSISNKNKPIYLTNVSDGSKAYILSQIYKNFHKKNKDCLIFITNNNNNISSISRSIKFLYKNVNIIEFPEWDCTPYDRISPSKEVVSKRINALNNLKKINSSKKNNFILITTINALMQKIPDNNDIYTTFDITKGTNVNFNSLIDFLINFGYEKVSTVIEKGSYAVRGGIIDIFPPNYINPIRIDFFGDEVESIKSFNYTDQKTISMHNNVTLNVANEILLHDSNVRTFNRNFYLYFNKNDNKELYESINNKILIDGFEHYFPLFYDKVTTLNNLIDNHVIVFDHLTLDSIEQRFEQIEDIYQARLNELNNNSFFDDKRKPLDASHLYMSLDQLNEIIDSYHIKISQYKNLDKNLQENYEIIKITQNDNPDFSISRKSINTLLFDDVSKYLLKKIASNKKIILSSQNEKSGLNLYKSIFKDKDVFVKVINNIKDITSSQSLYLCLNEFDRGADIGEFCFISESDILGDYNNKIHKKTKKSVDYINELTSLNIGDLIVHIDHGIGLFANLTKINANGIYYDCIELHYRDGDKLFIPVENIEMISLFGHNSDGVNLDKLGNANWQLRKAKIKKRIKDIADKLIQLEAKRKLSNAPLIELNESFLNEFNSYFPFNETDDQLNTLDSIYDDLQKGIPMDRLVCGDVGFGKTEIALRTSFAMVTNNYQVIVITPTTLLARQHYNTFVERFRHFSCKIACISRLVSKSDIKKSLEEIENGNVDIIIGTHALLTTKIKYKNLGMLIVDEEQHFGVLHKEFVKTISNNIHILTLTATPIPRTMQLAMNGVKDLSIIATPPVDRMAVNTSVMPFDPITIRAALIREFKRGGQSFFVCPRISDLGVIKNILDEYIPELNIQIAHGQMSSKELDQIIGNFYNQKFDLLLSTSIIESGLDIPTANTIIVYNANLFGLAQLYQLRGRVGRSKLQSFAYFTISTNKDLTERAIKRLEVLQSLDSLGAGFSLASHDLDIRGAGNILGDEQSGHVKEVGYELYQTMLEETISNINSKNEQTLEKWSPVIKLGLTFLIPDNYVEDLQLRLGLYKRLSNLNNDSELESFSNEMVDRFGGLPDAFTNLIKVIKIKRKCKISNISKIEAGPKGVVIRFYDKKFNNADGLINWIDQTRLNIKIKNNGQLIVYMNWRNTKEQLDSIDLIVTKIYDISKLKTV